MRIIFDAPAFARLHVDCELSRLRPATLEGDSYLLLAVAHHREEQHVHEVLQPSLQEGPPAIDQRKQAVPQVQVLNTLDLPPHHT